MSRPVIRVSEWAAGELRRRAATERRTIVSVVDALLERPLPFRTAAEVVSRIDGLPDGMTPEIQARAKVMGAEIVRQANLPRCPECGCSELVHAAGGSKTRCERHPACRWER